MRRVMLAGAAIMLSGCAALGFVELTIAGPGAAIRPRSHPDERSGARPGARPQRRECEAVIGRMDDATMRETGV